MAVLSFTILWLVSLMLENAGIVDIFWGPGFVVVGIYYALIPFTVLGGIVLRRRGIRLTPMLAMWPTVMFASAITFGLTRYRVPIDIAMMAMTGIAVAWIVDRLREPAPETPVAAPAGARAP